MSMCGVPVEVSGCYNNIELNWRYKWIKLTLKASERDENGTWMKVMRKVNAVKTKKCMKMKRDECSDHEGVHT